MQTSTRALLHLVPLALVDTFIPVPIVALLLVYVILSRPPWFAKWVRQIYDPAGG
ncbi:MAG TPA: hypothetical protein VGB13_07480 [Candidatus Krumholzibacteria bacterium]|jgi:hypothetical protein